MAALLDMILAKAPAANILVGKPTSITYTSILSYLTYGTNMPIFVATLQSLVNARRAQGQNVFVANLPRSRPQHDEERWHPSQYHRLSAMANK